MKREESEDGVEGEAEHECDEDPLAAECPPSPPTNLRLTRTGANLAVAYTLSAWRGSNGHWYRIELHRSRTRSGTFTSYRSDWDNVLPEEFNAVPRGYYYKARARRCRAHQVG